MLFDVDQARRRLHKRVPHSDFHEEIQTVVPHQNRQEQPSRALAPKRRGYGEPAGKLDLRFDGCVLFKAGLRTRLYVASTVGTTRANEGDARGSTCSPRGDLAHVHAACAIRGSS